MMSDFRGVGGVKQNRTNWTREVGSLAKIGHPIIFTILLISQTRIFHKCVLSFTHNITFNVHFASKFYLKLLKTGKKCQILETSYKISLYIKSLRGWGGLRVKMGCHKIGV